jgi:acetamidase/formamidase
MVYEFSTAVDYRTSVGPGRLALHAEMVPMDITSITVDCDIAQMVDVRKGVHCMVPKSIFVKK